MHSDIQSIRINKEFKTLLVELSHEEREQLKSNILSDGEFRDPLIVWDGTLIDGHNRLKIWQEFTDEEKQQVSPPRIKQMDLSDDTAAHDWIINNQAGRRNLTPTQRAYYIGKLYLAEKKNVADNLRGTHSETSKTTAAPADSPEGQNVPQSNSTAEMIGQRHGLSGKQVQRHAKYSDALDTIGQTLGSDAKQEILNGSKKIPASQVTMMASLPADEMQQAFDITTGRAVPPEPAKPQFDDKKFEADLGRVLRHIDARFNICGGKTEHHQCLQLMKKVFDIHRQWKRSHR